MTNFLRGLGRGMATTARTMLRPTTTQQYPHVKPDLPTRSRGVIALLEENCTSCMLCARECPDWCIYIDSHKETIEPGPEGGRARQHNVLDRFAIDFSLCMYCGICIEVCPFDALFWSPDFEYASGDIRDLLHEKEQLGEWMQTVPEETLPGGYSRESPNASPGSANASPGSANASRESANASPKSENASPGSANAPAANADLPDTVTDDARRPVEDDPVATIADPQAVLDEVASEEPTDTQSVTQPGDEGEAT